MWRGSAVLHNRHFFGCYAAMRIGLLMMPLHRVERAYADMPAEDANAILNVDRFGYEDARVGEYHTAKRRPIASPLIFMATLIGGATSC
jgi:hypothetical protein